MELYDIAVIGGGIDGQDFSTVLTEGRSRYSGPDRHWLARLLRYNGTLIWRRTECLHMRAAKRQRVMHCLAQRQ
jgi:hypothetical protein